jgi:cellulose synthase/poly-beta-1,6-N-acetylglucosamine synthase-like glycosyltransferase
MIANGLIALGIILFLLVILLPIDKTRKVVNREVKDICILIPARNESAVLENLLISIEDQEYKLNNHDVYVILESANDPSVDIVNKHHMTILYRHNLNLQRKGYALDEAIKDILKIKHYDAYFIFDADNVLDKKYLKEMIKTIKAGYDIGIGYRNTKNGNANIIATCSTLTFSLINTLTNKIRLKNQQTLIVSGTGFYISGYVINELKGYPFYSLTEDYELSLYAAWTGLTTFYNEKAIFYDEQPTSLNVSIKQRSRWIKGYFMARKHYIPLIFSKLFKQYNSSLFLETIGILPYLLIVIGLILKVINNINYLLSILIIIYGILFILTLFMLLKENKQLNLSLKSKILALFFNPLFLITYLYCLIIAVFSKNMNWEPINHHYKGISNK